MCVTIQSKDTIRRTVVENGVGILRSGNPTENFESLEVEHNDGLIVARGGESASGTLGHGGSMGALDTANLAKQLPIILVDDHHTILPRDEESMLLGVWDDVVPTAVTT